MFTQIECPTRNVSRTVTKCKLWITLSMHLGSVDLHSRFLFFDLPIGFLRFLIRKPREFSRKSLEGDYKVTKLALSCQQLRSYSHIIFSISK